MPLPDSFDETLAAARSGAEWAWTALYDDLAPSILGYLRLRGAAEPEDLAGEVFLQVVRNVNRFEGDEPAFRSWLFVIAHNRLIDERRRRSRRPADPAPAEVIELRGSTGDAEQEAVDALSTDGVRRLLGTLSGDQRDVLLLRIVGGLTVDEVAQAIGKRPGAVKALQRRGLATIRRRLSEQGVPP